MPAKAAVCALMYVPKGSVSCGGCGRQKGTVSGREDIFYGCFENGPGNSGKLVTDVKMAMLKHAPETELAIIDGSPGIGCPVIASVSGMDLVLIVAEPSQSGISDLKRLVKPPEPFRQVWQSVSINGM